ncbi:ABC transporter substrate-binding protein [Clostridium estertheticum]|uniref:ABC transporter substrate-binding protein n=1 Tax=Clostridium estertheticum TaxID=238834 RepID=UPI0013E91CD8|nr:ABC transporter substrate-binding protein [Clostridium estertheticum]MBZ9686528.1 ABC transporter substrate-binding protein [Clostridium estertheticum]
MNKRKIQRKISFALVCMGLVGVLATGCSKNSIPVSSTSKSSEKKVTLKLAMWGEGDYKYMNETNKLVDAYKKDHPNVTIELEHIAPKEYDNTMKIRSTANQLPDIFPIRQANLTLYADLMVPLNDLKAVKNNLYANETAIKGNIIGIPQSVFNEYVYYDKNIFKEYNLKVPTTWEDFIKVAQTIKEGKKYTPLALGLKDSWVNYPLNEYMPMLEAGDGQIYNKMATKDDPFTKGQPFYNAYAKIQKLYDAKVCGNDPLGYGWDQAGAMFVAGKAAMIAAGSWYKDSFNQAGGKDESIGVFLLPTRNKTSDDFYTTAMTEALWGISKSSKNQPEAKEFIEWFFGSDYYGKLVTALNIKPTVKGLTYNDKFFSQAFTDLDVKPITVFYDEAYNKVKNAMKFDVNGIGQQMTTGKSFDSMVQDLNAQWKKARAN